MAFTTITGASGAPTTYTGTDGVDLITLVNPGASVLQGEAGNDVINVSLAGQNGATVNTASNQTLRGGQGDDAFTITGGNLINSLIAGNLGNDSFIGSVIASTIQGGQGNDVLTLTGSNGGAFVNGNLGNDTLTATTAATYSSSSLLGGQGNDTIILGGTNVIAQGVRLEGNLGNDTITINALAAGSVGVTATGGAGNDVINAASAGIATALFGGDGNDTLTSDGSGSGTVSGGEGIDTITITNRATEQNGGGTTIDLTEIIQLRDIVISENAVNPTAANAFNTITGTGNNGSITGFDVIIGLHAGGTAALKDNLQISEPAQVQAQAAETITVDSVLTVNGQVLTSATTVGANGFTTFNLNDGSTLVIDSNSKLAAAVDLLNRNALGTIGDTVVFNATIGGVATTYVYTALTAAAAGASTSDGYNLFQVNGTFAGMQTTATNASGIIFVTTN